MSKRPYKKTAASVVAVFKAHPDWTSIQIGRALGLMPEHVRSTLRRKGLKLKNGPGRPKALTPVSDQIAA